MSDGINILQKLVERNQLKAMSKEICNAAGYDAGINGPNEDNCNHKFFSSPEFTAAWLKGKNKAEDEKMKKLKKQ